MSIINQINKIRFEQRLNKSEFEQLIGKGRGYLSSLERKGSAPSIDFIKSIKKAFPMYSYDFLLDGDELVNETKHDNSEISQKNNYNQNSQQAQEQQETYTKAGDCIKNIDPLHYIDLNNRSHIKNLENQELILDRLRESNALLKELLNKK